MSIPLRLAFVTDIHHGGPSLTKKGSAALPLLAEFRRFANDARADAVIDMGDRISDENPERDAHLEAEVAEAFAGFAMPRFHIVGNHDRDNLSVADNARIFGADMAHRCIDLGAWRMVMWQAETKLRYPQSFAYLEADAMWLAHTVATADRPLLIVSHVPVSGHSQIGNYYFEANPAFATYADHDAIRKILATAKVPVLWISGHVHWNTLTRVDGIPHLTLQSLTETFTTGHEPAGAFGLLEIGERMHWTVTGRDPFHASFDAADSLRRWHPPLPPFDQMAELRARHEKQRAAG